ncbi:MAG: bifunctional riboflavin kinase/FAD synthetase [Syntrophomonadaceae bacterium]|nr:bifunctional riboflavin kinase/FAD synthetase [Syntrophomonadaceae bacterium]
MQIIQGLDIPAEFRERRAVLALGNFDGIHRGHQALIKAASAAAAAGKGYAAALVFDPHPMRILFPERAPRLIIAQDYQSRLFRAYGLDAVYYYPFSPELARCSPESFVRQMLVESLNVSEVIVGFNYTFGHKGSGNPDTLKELGGYYGFAVQVIDPVLCGSEVISSSLIRQRLNAGDVRKARELLGYYPVLQGVVIEGEKRGRTIGVPTANLGVDSTYNIPAKGVYAAFATVEGEAETFRAVVNIGSKPTFHERYPLSAEAHIFDFAGDIYDRAMTLYLVERLRDEQRFDGIEALVRQIRADGENARACLAAAPLPEYR